jgi:hypothetical protein
LNRQANHLTKMMKYRLLTKEEEEQALLQIVQELDKPLKTAGKHRQSDWIKGWANVKVPQYFGKYKINRLSGKLVMALSKDYERDALYSILDPLFKKYFTSYDVYEFGCGTGHNLQRVQHECMIHGFDWANPQYPYFDFFNPEGKIVPHSNVYTVAALEQTGKNYKKFVTWLIRQKPKIVVHVEPIPELLNPKNLLDYLSIKYMEKRKYLSGYLTYLQSLEKQGKIKILEARRSGIGSLFIDGYSIVVWKPI